MDCLRHAAHLLDVQSVVERLGSREECCGPVCDARLSGAVPGLLDNDDDESACAPAPPLSPAFASEAVKVATKAGPRSRKENMLKFLTHKLRTHSINEDNNYNVEKAEEDRDSGTESDEEIDEPDLPPSVMSDRMCSVSPADTGCSMESPAPDQHDPHSSEEELEVINSQKEERPARPLRATSVCLPEKRKWSQVGESRHHKYTPENEENMSQFSNLSPASPCSPYHKCYGEDGVHNSGSSDEEVHHLLASMATPVQFRTSPPLEAVKPGRRTPLGRSMSPPPKLLHYEVSPRKRSRHARHAHMQRPYLDFEKMQHLKARSVRTWRHSGDHGGELSVFCW